MADCAAALGWDPIVFFDDAMVPGSQSGPWTVVGTSSELIARPAEWDAVFVGIGNNTVRLDWHTKLAALGAPSTNLLHPTASISPHSVLGTGVFVAAGAVINIGAQIGDAAIINTGATVDHDCALQAGAHISPGANLAGSVRAGKRAWIGIGAAVRQEITVGADAVIGAGAVVISQVSDGATVVGNPARPINKSDHA